MQLISDFYFLAYIADFKNKFTSSIHKTYKYRIVSSNRS